MESGGTRGTVVVSDTMRRTMTPQEEQVVQDIIKNFMATLGRFQQYPSMNQIVKDAMNKTQAFIEKWLRTHASFECISVQSNLQVNHSILNFACQQKDFVQAFLFYLMERNVRTFELKRGVTFDEMQRFYQFFSKPANEIVKKSNFSRALKRMGVKRVELSSEMIMENVVINTKMSDELTRKLSRLNINELVEKANVIAQLDIETLHKVGDLASMVTNLSYTKNEKVTKKILDRLSQTLHGDDNASRLASAKTFSQIAEKAMDYTLFDLHTSVGDQMATQMTREKDPEVFSVLATSLEQSAQIHIAKGDYDMAMKIVAGLDRKTQVTSPMKKRAEKAIDHIAEPSVIKRLVRNLEAEDRQKRNYARDILAKLGDKPVPDLIDLLYTTEEDWAFESAVQILTDIGENALTELYFELNEDMDDRFRASIIKVIGAAGNVRSIKKIIPFLDDENESVRTETFRAMLNIGGPAAEAKVLENLKTFKATPEFFKSRVTDFGSFKNEGMVRPLLDYLDGNGDFAAYVVPEIQVLAVRSLGLIGTREAVDGLCHYLSTNKGFMGLKKRNEQVDLIICTVLGRIGNPCAVPALKKAEKGKFKSVKAAALTAQKLIGKVEEDQGEQAPSEKPCAAVPKTECEPVATDTLPPNVPVEKVNETPVEQDDASEYTFMQLPDKENTIMGDGATFMAGPDETGAGKTFMGGFDRMDDSLMLEPDMTENPVRIILCVGSAIVDNIGVSIPGVVDELLYTADQKGALFDLLPGNYEVLVKDKGLEITKTIEIKENQTEVLLNLQDIFNF